MAIALATLLAACTVGEVDLGDDDGSGGGSGGGQSFNMIVKPLITECVACHSKVPPPAISQPPSLQQFSDLQAMYKTKPGASNILVTKGSLTAGVHQGLPYLTTEEQATVAQWIDSLP